MILKEKNFGSSGNMLLHILLFQNILSNFFDFEKKNLHFLAMRAPKNAICFDMLPQYIRYIVHCVLITLLQLTFQKTTSLGSYHPLNTISSSIVVSMAILYTVNDYIYFGAQINAGNLGLNFYITKQKDCMQDLFSCMEQQRLHLFQKYIYFSWKHVCKFLTVGTDRTTLSICWAIYDGQVFDLVMVSR